MKAIRIHRQDDTNTLVYEDVPQPQPAAGEVLVPVYATSVTPAELGWGATWKTNAGLERRFPIPGHELSGLLPSLARASRILKSGTRSMASMTLTRMEAKRNIHSLGLVSLLRNPLR